MLFGKIRRRTRLQIMAPILVSLFLACTTILTVVSQSYFGSYNESARQYIAQKEKAVGLFLRLIEETSMQYSDGGERPVPGLDRLVQMNKNILCAAYLPEQGQLSVASKTAGYPDHEALTAVPQVRRFLLGDEDSLWFVRSTAVARVYRNKEYDVQKGVLTYLRREGSGVLVIDIDPSALFSIIDSTGRQHDGVLIQSDGLVLCADTAHVLTGGEKSAIAKLLTGSGSSVTVAEKHAKVFRVGVTDELMLTAQVSYGYVIDQILTLALPILLLTVLFAGISVCTSGLLTGTVIHPMEKLYNKMRQEKLADISEE